MKPLSSHMIEVLMECHERELLKLEPYIGASHTQGKRALLQRGFLEAKMHPDQSAGKNIMAFFITEAGKEYLNALNNKRDPSNCPES